MPGYKFHYFDKSLIRSMNTALRSSLAENNQWTGEGKSVGQKTTTTPEEIAQRAYSNTPRSAGEVSPQFKQQFDRAFANQRDVFNRMSPEAQKQASVMYGNPNDPAYRTVEFGVQKKEYESPTLYGLSSGRDVTISTKAVGAEGKVLPHEMTHQQQFRQSTPGIADTLRTDQQKPYGEQDIEAGAESKAQVMQTRGSKSPEDALKTLTPQEVEGALEKTRSGTGSSSPYSGFDKLKSETQTELKDYLRHMIVKGAKPQGTMA